LRPVDLRAAVCLRLEAFLRVALARLVAFFAPARARVVAFLRVALARVVAFLRVALARVVAFLRVALARLVAFFAPARARVVAFLRVALARLLRVGFLAAPRARADAFFAGVGARFTGFFVSAGAAPTISSAARSSRSAVSHDRSGGGSADGAGGGAGSAGVSGSGGVSGAPPHGEVYPSLLGSSTSYMATSFPCLRSMLPRVGRWMRAAELLGDHVVNDVYEIGGVWSWGPGGWSDGRLKRDEMVPGERWSAPVVGVDDEPGDDGVWQRGDEERPVRVEGVRQRHHGEAEKEQDHDRSETAAFGHALILWAGRPSRRAVRSR
jgi:hypothetical protein